MALRTDPIDIFAAEPSRFTAALADLLARRIEITLDDARKEITDGTDD